MASEPGRTVTLHSFHWPGLLTFRFWDIGVAMLRDPLAALKFDVRCPSLYGAVKAATNTAYSRSRSSSICFECSTSR